AHLVNATYVLTKLADRGATLGQSRGLRPPTEASDDEAADKAFRKALEPQPAQLDAQLALVNFLWAVDRADESEAVLRRAADANPGSSIANRAMAGFYIARQRDTEGERYLKRAANADSGLRIALADFYVRKNRDDDAIAVLGAADD